MRFPIFLRATLSMCSLAGAGLCLSMMPGEWNHMSDEVTSSPEVWSLSLEGCLVVVDPGHGGHDGGTQGHGALEKDLSLTMAKVIRDHLTKAGIPVMMTREDDTFVELAERSEIANRAGATVFLSIHLNADPVSADTAGVEFYHCSRKQLAELATLKRNMGFAPEINIRDIRSELLAGMLQKRVCRAIGGADRGVRDSNYLVVMQARCAAVLLECGYLTNAEESKRLQEKATHEKLAGAVTEALKKYLTAVTMNPGRGLIFAHASEAVGPPASVPTATREP